MLSRPVACCSAVHRTIRATPEAVWITDDVLSSALQRFCLIKRASKRNASAVPGPMESRRRMGKRRIAQLSEAVQTPWQDFGALWGVNGASDKQQWQWEAPSTRQNLPAIRDAPYLPAWLNEYQPSPPQDSHKSSRPEESISADRREPYMSTEEDLCIFRESLRASSTSRLQSLCDSFNHDLKQNLVLGLVSEDGIYKSLQNVTECIQEVTSDKLLAASRCLSFYTSVWNGITACKILRPAELGSHILERLMLLLAELPCTTAVQKLATDVMQAACEDQIRRMECGILTVMRAWLSTWATLELKNGLIDMKATALHKTQYTVPIRQPLTESVNLLVRFLDQLPRNMVPNILHASTNYLISTVFANFKGPLRTIRALRYSWVSSVANTTRVNEDLLISIWSRMESSQASSKNSDDYIPKVPRLSLHETCDLLLDFWISHGQMKAAESVKAAYMASVQKSAQSESAGLLLQAVNQYHGCWWKRAQSLFRFLRRLGKPRAVYHTLRNLQAHNLIPSAAIVAGQIQRLSYTDTRCALNIYKLCQKVEQGKKRLLPDWCPDLIIAMIRSSEFDPAEIWGVLRIPQPDSSWAKAHCKPLHKARVRLVERMAMEFAVANCRSPRLALRNVVHCILYLRRHGEPASANLCRALTEAGIARSLLDERWIGWEKAAWILNTVQKGEGPEVSAKMDQILQHLSCMRRAKQQRLQREANPLRVGPVD